MKTHSYHTALVVKTGVKAGSSEQLTIYGTSSCPWCNKQKEYLKGKNIAYKFVDCSTGKCPELVTGYPTTVVSGYYEY